MSETPRMQHFIPDEHLIQLGDIVVSFSLLEDNIKRLVGLVLGGNDMLTNVLTAELPFKNIRALVVSLFILRGESDPFYKDVKSLMTQAGKIEEDRNRLMHSIWIGSGDSIVRVKITAKENKGLVFKEEEVTKDDLQRVATKIKNLSADITAFRLRYMRETSLFVEGNPNIR